MVTGEEMLEVVELEEEGNDQEVDDREKKDTDDMSLDENTKLAGIEFRGLKGQARGQAGIMEWQGVII